MALGSIIGAFGSIAGGLLGGSSASKASKQQAAALQQAQAYNQQNVDQGTDRLQPTMDLGNLAQQVLAYELGLGEKPVISHGGYQVGGQTYDTEAQAIAALDTATQAFNSGAKVYEYGPPAGLQDQVGGERRLQELGLDNPYQQRETFDPGAGISAAGFDPRGASVQALDPQYYEGFSRTPGQDFLLKEGLDAVTSQASAMGSRNSGATQQALQQRGTQLNNTFRNEYLASLGALSTQGQQAATNLLGAGTQTAGLNASLAAGVGNAQAAGTVGQGNAFGQAIALGANTLANNFGGLNNITSFSAPSGAFAQGHGGIL